MAVTAGVPICRHLVCVHLFLGDFSLGPRGFLDDSTIDFSASPSMLAGIKASHLGWDSFPPSLADPLYPSPASAPDSIYAR
jgi:hypothetical protein